MNRLCDVDGCDRKHYGRGLCRSHYVRKRRSEQTGPQCVIDGCTGLREARGWCKLHYDRWASNGDPLVKRLPSTAFQSGQSAWNAGTAATHTCQECGAQFTRHGRARKHRFCSKPCQHRAYSGERNPNWKGGVTSANEKVRKSDRYLAWRAAVFLRDDFTCQFCGVRGGVLNADHIKPFASHPELRLEVSNGRTLCVPCHRSTPTYGRPA